MKLLILLPIHEMLFVVIKNNYIIYEILNVYRELNFDF